MACACPARTLKLPRKDFEVPRGDFQALPQQSRRFQVLPQPSRHGGRRKARTGRAAMSSHDQRRDNSELGCCQDHDRTGRDTFHGDESEVPRRAFCTLSRQSRRDRRRRMRGDVVAIRKNKRRDNHGRSCEPRSRPDKVSHLVCR